MIVTVTMNPAIDKTVTLENFEEGKLNLIDKSVSDVGGKGINVSKTLAELGLKSLATGFIAGEAGQRIEKYLHEAGIDTGFIKVPGETRTNTKIVDKKGNLTELNEKGPEIASEYADKLVDLVSSYADKDSLFVFAGSVPRGVRRDIYALLIKKVHEKGAIAILDADGDLFCEGLKAAPDIIKPNRAELEKYLMKKESLSEDEIVNAGSDLIKAGTKKVVVSLGSEGAIFISKDDCYRCPGLKVKAHSAVGAGDAMVAALAYAAVNSLSDLETARLCMATSAGAVETIGTKPPKKEAVERLKGEVIAERI